MKSFPLSFFVFFAPLIICAEDKSFERDGWPGEGIPVFESKVHQLTLYEGHSLESKRKIILFQRGWKVVYDKSKVITKSSVIYTVTKPFTVEYCENGQKDVKAKQGDKFEYLQYEAEGYGIIRLGNTICHMDMNDPRIGVEATDDKPQIEWWVRVIYKNKSFAGWLFVDDTQVKFLQRQF